MRLLSAATCFFIYICFIFNNIFIRADDGYEERLLGNEMKGCRPGSKVVAVCSTNDV